MKSPVLIMFAGPNGSGKSTITSNFNVVGEYVNADDIQRHLGCDALSAAKIAEATREYLLSENMDFTMESVLSTPRNYELMERAKGKGYKVVCIYVLTKDPEINVSRVLSRKRNGGHDVPPEKVRLRYRRAMKLFPRLFSVCDEIYVFDNSCDRDEGEPHAILKYQYGDCEIYPNEVFTRAMIERLLKGEYEA